MKLMTLASGFRVSALIAAAAELGIADAIAAGDTDVESIARRVGARPELTRRLLRALVAFELIAEPSPGRYALTPVGEALRGDGIRPVRDGVLMMKTHVSTWYAMAQNLRDGVHAFRAVHGKPVFDWFVEHPEEHGVFDRAMTAFTRAAAVAVAQTYDFSKLNTLVDVGGGEGTLLLGILAAHPHCKGVVADLAPVIARAKEKLARDPVGARIRGEPIDFFQEVPSGGDAYLLKTVLHDWNDEQAHRILTSVRRAIGERPAKLIVVERVLDAKPDPAAVLADLNMMVMCDGKERDEAEWRALFERGGFALERIIPLPPTAQGLMILEARPA
jgi:hypothetical protein